MVGEMGWPIGLADTCAENDRLGAAGGERGDVLHAAAGCVGKDGSPLRRPLAHADDLGDGPASGFLDGAETLLLDGGEAGLIRPFSSAIP